MYSVTIFYTNGLFDKLEHVSEKITREIKSEFGVNINEQGTDITQTLILSKHSKINSVVLYNTIIAVIFFKLFINFLLLN